MAVVINEFEVVPEQQPAQQGQQQPTAPTPEAPAPRDLAELLRRAQERAARVRAH